MISWPGTSGSFGSRSFAVDDVEIGAAYAAGADLDEQLAGGRLTHRQLARLERPAGAARTIAFVCAGKDMEAVNIGREQLPCYRFWRLPYRPCAIGGHLQVDNPGLYVQMEIQSIRATCSSWSRGLS